MALRTRNYPDYSGGLNDTVSPKEVDKDEASVLNNWLIRNQGQLIRRNGLTQVGDDLSFDDFAGGMHAYLRSDGGKDLMIMDGDALRYLNGSSWSSIDDGFSSGKPFWMETCPVNDKLYISNEDNTTHSWNRVSTTLNSSLTDLGNTKYQANVLRWHKNHMFFLNNLTVDTDVYPNSIGWSLINDPDTHDTVNDRINIPGNGRVITAVDQGDVLVIFKERAIQFLEGWGSNSWQITDSSSNVANFDEQIGCIAPRGACRVGNEVWFIDHEGQIRRIYQTDFDAFRRDVISTKIQTTLSGMNKTQLSKAVAWSNNDYVFFSFPTGASTVNDVTMVFDLLASKRTGEEAWVKFTGWSVGMMIDYFPSATPVLYIADANAAKIYSHTGDDDDGVAIDAEWTGKDDDYGYPSQNKRLKYGYITASSGESDVSVGVYASVDQGPFAHLDDIDLTASGDGLGPTGNFRLGPTGTSVLGGSTQNELKFYYTGGGGNPRGKSIRHSIRHAALDETPTVNSFTSHYRPRDVR